MSQRCMHSECLIEPRDGGPCLRAAEHETRESVRCRSPVCDRLADLSRLVAWSACGLALVILYAGSARAEPVPISMLEQRVIGTAHAMRDDPHFKKMSVQQIQNGIEFVAGNALFVLIHESAHALINELGIPVLGREEDAADAMATLVLLRMGEAFADRVVVNAAKGWFLSDQRDRKDGVPNAYYDEHGMDLQRAYYIVCLLVGGQPGKFKALADEVQIPEERQHTCRDDFNNASWSWKQALDPHRRAPDQPKTTITVTYGPATTEQATLAEIARRLKILEGTASHLSHEFAWKRAIALEMQTCGDPGARWELRAGKVIVCYEIIAEFRDLYRKYGNAALVPGIMKMTKNKKMIIVAKPGAFKNRGRKSLRSDRAGVGSEP